MKKFLLLFFTAALFFNLNVNAQLTAAFSGTPLSGCSPVLVQFTNECIGNPTTYFWDLGNGITSNLANPSTTYFNPGNYTIKLVITKGAQKDSVIKINYVKVDATPVVNFTAIDSVGCIPFTAQFTNLASVPLGTIATYLWDFGDGTTSALPNPSHVYNVSGFYTVSLTIISNANCIKSFSKVNFINAKEKPVASFTSLIQPACAAPVTVNFTNTTTGPPILTYSWNFNDPASGPLNTTTTTSPSHVFNAAGIYNINMIASSTNGCTNNASFVLNVGSGTLNANFSMPNTGCVGDVIPIVNTTIPTPSSVLWDFGDATSSTQITPIKTFAAPGIYRVILYVTLGTCTSNDTNFITINPKPVSNFIGTPFVGCAVPTVVTFNNQTTGMGNTYLWTFGDGTTSTAVAPTHTYNAEGVFTVTLTTTNSFGCSHTFTRPNFIQVAKPVLTLSNMPRRGCIPYSYTPTYTITSSDPIVAYNWNFGDGTTGTGASPNHIYTVQGTYTIKVVFTTSSGCVDSTVLPAAIIVGSKPSTQFNAFPRDTCAQFVFNFFDNTPPPVDEWFWSFGDGGTSILQNPIYQYSDTGFFTVGLVTTNNGCRDTLIKNNFIYVKPPIAIFGYTPNCDTPFLIRFLDYSIGAVTYAWNFGDGNTSVLQNPVHNYALPGTYNVSLVVSNGSCTYTTNQIINIVNESPDFNASLTQLCKGNSTVFSAANINVNNIAGYNWQFGDGTTSNAISPSHIYTNSGTYNVTLITTSILGCFDTVIKNNYITVFGPSALFSVLNNRACTNQGPISFNNFSVTDGVHPIVNTIWNFGDGNTLNSLATPVTHIYTTNGSYTIKLLVTDSYGCSDSIIRPNFVTTGSATAAFISPDTASCPTKNIRFINQSFTNIATNVWSFGDGQTSSLPNPTHTYAADGNYTIKLVVTDVFGCIDSITKPTYINIISPKAIFAVSDSFKTCPPLIVNYTNNSLNALQNNWGFGDASFSTLLNPTHVFNVPGAFVSKLVVTSQGGCKDSAVKTIRINGPSGTFTYAPLTGCAPLTVNFASTAINTLNYIWDYADGNTSSTNLPTSSHVFNNVGTYLPKLILEDALGCRTTAIGLDTISTYGVSGIIKANKYLICGPGDGLIQFSDSITSNDTYNFISWNFGDGTIINSAVPPTHLYTTPGVYYPTALVSTTRGCLVTLRTTAPIRFVRKPNIVLSTDTSKCVPASFNITALSINSDTAAVNYNWTLPLMGTSTSVVPPIFNTNNAGSFPLQLIIQDGFGCRDTAGTILEARPLPIVNAGLDSFVCRGNSINLLATGALTYIWNPNFNLSCLNCNNPTAAPLADTSFIVTGFTQFGCQAKDTVAIKVQQPFVLSSDPGGTICPGFGFQLNARGADKYLWSPNNGTLNNINIANPIARPLATTTYTVTGSDNKNCFNYTNSITVNVATVPTINAGPDRTVAVGEVVNINPIVSPDVVSFTWTPSLYLACSTCPTTTSTPFSNILYQIEVANSTGCKFRDSININVFCEANNIFLPNTFSPNADGSNDVFYVRARGQLIVKSFRIYNRWGQQVFGRQELVPNNIAMGWDGTFNGKKLEPDVYVYHLDVICNGEFKGTIKGNVTLIK
jgi:gliding motility-associated-like protein